LFGIDLITRFQALKIIKENKAVIQQAPEGKTNLQGQKEENKKDRAASFGRRHRRDKQQQPLSFGMSIAAASVRDTSVRITALAGSNQITSFQGGAQLVRRRISALRADRGSGIYISN
jgi:hypothetical protein